VLGIVLPLICAARLTAQTGTFIDRWSSTDLRVVSYNIHLDDIFPNDNPTQAAKFARVMQALMPDVINLQEIYNHTAAQTASLMDSILPLAGGATWYAHQSFDNVLVSKYPLLMMATDTIPDPPSTSYAMALVNLPDTEFDVDFYFMNSHFKCCSDQGFEEDRRRQQADALVNWMRDARTPGGHVNLSAGTPMAVVGDLNVVQGLTPLNTLLTGDITNESVFGPDSPPDWDGTSLADAHPVHNGSGSIDWTYRSGSFTPSRLDYILYTDSDLRMANNYVLNTVSMSPDDRAATGLQQYDVTITTTNYDHLPVVVDFRFPLPGDYNGDRVVDNVDFERWRNTFGSTTILDADGNGNQVVDAGDYVVWRKWLSSGSGAGSFGDEPPVPEPASNLLWLMACGAVAIRQRGSR
jgi:endonuclease/exonuclease/phosphatase family metal-dependent hydrolase